MNRKIQADKLLANFFAIGRFLKGRMKFEKGSQHLSLLQLQALVLIKEKGEVNMNEIASHFKVKKPTATSLLDKLSELGLVKRKEDNKDRRKVRVNLTKKGEELFKKAAREREKKLNELLLFLNKKDLEELLRITNNLVESLAKK